MPHPQWVLISACCTLYGLAFAFPAVTSRHAPSPVFEDMTLQTHFETRLRNVVASGDHNNISGPEAFTLTWALHEKSWWGNMGMWLGTILLAYRLWSCAA